MSLEALKVPGGRVSQTSRQSAHEGGKVVSTIHRLLLPPRKYSWYSFLLEAESTTIGNRTSIFLLVSQCLSQLHHLVTHFYDKVRDY